MSTILKVLLSTFLIISGLAVFTTIFSKQIDHAGDYLQDKIYND
ncbi:hypothetical protein [Weissella paramesenteroides]|nr:hypothetical protein [Weissella paramesenteroides]